MLLSQPGLKLEGVFFRVCSETTTFCEQKIKQKNSMSLSLDHHILGLATQLPKLLEVNWPTLVSLEE